MAVFGEPETWGMNVSEFADKKDSIERLSRTELAEKLGIKASAIEKAKGNKTRLWQSILKYMDAEKTGQTRPEYYTPKKGVKVNEAVKQIKQFSGTAAQSLPRETYGNVKTNIGQVKDLLNKSKEPLDIRQVKEMLPNLNQETIRTSLNVLKKDPNFKNKILSIDPATTAPYKVNQDIKKLLSDKKIINVLDSGKFPTDAQIKSVLKTDPTITERRSVDLAETLTGRRDIGDFKVPTKYKNISNQYLTNVEKTSSLFGPKKTRARSYYENQFTKTLNLPENIRRLRSNILSKIQNIIPELKGSLAVDEIAGLTSSVRNLSTPYGIFGQVLGKDFNTSVKGFGIDGLKGIYEKKLAGLSPDDPERLKIQKNYNAAVDKFETAANKNNPAKKVKGFKIVFEPPSKAIGNKKIYNQYKDLFDAHYDKYKFSFKVPADTDSLVDISNKLDTPAFQKTIKNRVSKLVGKGGKLGALVALGTLAGTGFSLADEPGVEGIKETSLMDEVLGPKGVVAGGASLLTKPGRKLALKLLQVAGTPLAGVGFGVSEYLRGRDEGKTRFESATQPGVGLSLVAPGVVSKGTPELLRGILGLGRFARMLTPVGIGLMAAGQAKDFYDQYQNLQALKETDPQAYESFMKTRVSEPMSEEQYSEIQDMGREGAMSGGVMRKGYANGPEDPTKRKFMKVGLGILGALPFGVGKVLQKPAVQEAITKAAPAAEQGWSWVKDNFWTVVNTVNKKAKKFTKLKDGEVKIHKDVEVIENPETIRVRYKTDNGNTAETVYNKPYKEVDPNTNEVIDIPGEFQEYQDVYRSDGKDIYKDFEEEIIDSIEGVKNVFKKD